MLRFGYDGYVETTKSIVTVTRRIEKE
jgi:hypothetical protein